MSRSPSWREERESMGIDDRGFETKTCPRCGSELYADMRVCFGCLYDFSRDRPERSGEGLTAVLSRAEAPSTDKGMTEDVGVLVKTPVVDVWRGVGPEGVDIGREASNDVTFHLPVVSRRHLRVVPTPDGMEVSDRGSKNPATYNGREIRGTVVVTYGDSIDVCGCSLVMTGPRGRAACEDDRTELVT